ncbi:MAG: hypothetical protein U5R14_11000 [Gemmatimonadota bacterium]|nr:hypothetical protein [Gemmatimonadota bacterium]
MVGGSPTRRLVSITVAALLLGGTLGARPWDGAVPLPNRAEYGLADTLRTLQPEDLFRLHRIGEVRFSPDGGVLAYERVRPGEEGPTKMLPDFPQARSEIWLARTDGGEPRPVAGGEGDGTGWFHPRWSPDGEHLAFLSVEGNEVRAWIWERASGETRLLTDRRVHLTQIGALLFHWVSPEELAVAVGPEGALGRGRILAEQTRPGLFAARRWEASWSGQEVTVDVLDSEPSGDDANPLPAAEVLVVGTDGSSRVATEGRWGLTAPSPDGRWLATFSHPPVPPTDPERTAEQMTTFGTRPGFAPLTAR